MTNKQKRHICASVGTLLFMLLVLLLLWFIYLRAYQPEEEEGIEIAFGEVPEAGGSSASLAQSLTQQETTEPVTSSSSSASTPSSSATENVITESDEVSLEVTPSEKDLEKERAEQEAREKAAREAKEKAEKEAKEKAEKEAKEKAEREAKEKAEAERKAKEAEAKAKAASWADKFGGTGNSSSTNGQGTGPKDNPIGLGSGTGRDPRIQGLNGRNLRSGKLPEPDCVKPNFAGTIAVRIEVDKDGKVTKARAGIEIDGTDKFDEEMFRCVEKTILQSVWTEGTGNAAGIILYTFINK